jgi:NhaA family Na+:H+ antiporter
MATDVAFALAVLAVLGSRIPSELTTFLLALAVVDDIGAVIVIALFYGDGLHLGWLALAAVGLVAIYGLQRARVWWTPVYLVLGVGVWGATVSSGVHATLAGVALGLLTPARPLLRRREVEQLGHDLAVGAERSEDELRAARFTLRESTSVASTVQHLLHPWTAFVVIPLFALANAGVTITADGLRNAATSRISLGVVLGLVVGKAVGVAGAVAIATRRGIATLPDGVTQRHITGVAALAGIGFTVSLFVAGLAFEGAAQVEQATLGIMAGSVVAAAAGTVLLLRAPRPVDDGEVSLRP